MCVFKFFSGLGEVDNTFLVLILISFHCICVLLILCKVLSAEVIKRA